MKFRIVAESLGLLGLGVILLAGCSCMNEPSSISRNGSHESRASSLPRPATMEIIAHRGASVDAPENTVVAYQVAWEQDACAGEVDIFLTADNKIVALHDQNLKRTTGLDKNITKVTYEEIRRLDAGSWFDARFAGEPIPLLEDILVTIPPGRKMFVEFKCGPEAIPYLEEIMERTGTRRKIEIIGFNLQTMTEAKKAFPDIPVYWLRGTRKDEDTGDWLTHDLGWIDMAKARNLDGLNVNFGGMTPHFADAVRESGLRLLVWTVNNPVDAKRMRELGVEGLTTDVPKVMKEQFHR